MLEEIEGFIIKEIDYSETSKIIHVISKEHKIISIMCKGVKSIKSPLRALTLKFTYGKFYIYYKENKLSLLKSVDIIDNLSNIKTNLILCSYSAYICDLTYQVAKQNSDDNLYDIFINTILKINQGLDPLILTNILEVKLLDFLGVSLNLDSCNICGNTHNIVTIDSSVGGYVCSKCLTNQRKVSLKTIKMLRLYYYVDISSITDLKISDTTKNQINDFLSDYYDRYTGLYLKSKQFLTDVLKKI